MEPKFRWEWYTDDSGEHVRVVWYTEERPEGVEVCRMVPGRTDDRTGCILRATIICEAMAHLTKHQADGVRPAERCDGVSDPLHSPGRSKQP